MNMFRKKINDITIDDIEMFIAEKHPENIRLEYKSGFSSTNANLQIAKEVSAFANQQGGIILYGVTEEAGGTRRPDALIGIDKVQSPRQKIQSVCIDHIHSPVTPEIQECALRNDNTKVIVVVRVDMSDAAPHTINSKTGFYIRSQDRCDPREMTEDEISLLMNRREKIAQRRDWLLERTYNRVFPPDVKRNYMLTASIFTAIPAYPISLLAERTKLYEIYGNSAVPQGQGFPIETSSIKTASDSIYAYFSPKGDEKVTVRKERYGEINVWGQISYFENAIHNWNSIQGIWLSYELRNLYLMVKFAANFYSNLGYWGIIKFMVKVEHCRGVKLIAPRSTWGFSDELAIMELDSEISIERQCSVMEMVTNPDEFIEDIFKEYIWAIGLSIHRVNSMPIGYWLDMTKMELHGKKRCPKCNKREISNIDTMCRECRKQPDTAETVTA